MQLKLFNKKVVQFFMLSYFLVFSHWINSFSFQYDWNDYGNFCCFLCNYWWLGTRNCQRRLSNRGTWLCFLWFEIFQTEKNKNWALNPMIVWYCCKRVRPRLLSIRLDSAVSAVLTRKKKGRLFYIWSIYEICMNVYIKRY